MDHHWAKSYILCLSEQIYSADMSKEVSKDQVIRREDGQVYSKVADHEHLWMKGGKGVYSLLSFLWSVLFTANLLLK